MKHSFFSLIFMLLTGSAYSATESQKICYSDMDNQCFIVTYDKDTLRTSSISYPDYQRPSSYELADEMKELGVNVSPVDALQFSLFSRFIVSTTVTTLAEQRQALNQTDPKVILNWRQGGRCIGGVALCAGSTFQTIATGGLTFLLAEIGCGLAALECLDMIDNINVWSTAQRELELEHKKNNNSTSNGVGSTAQEGGHGGSSAGIPTPVRETVVPVGVVTIHEGGAVRCSPDAGGHVLCRKPL
ncbi:MAG: hypothetical protein NTX25_02225 [Proteobacteria bacterium]|nr:hypothetical protein [Pseudomonadota bacterium]